MLKAIPYILKANKRILNASSFFSTVSCRRAINSRFVQTSTAKVLFCASSSKMYHNSGEVMDFLPEKEKYLKLSLEEKRSQYACKSKFTTLNDVLPWSQYAKKVNPIQDTPVWSKNPALNEKVSIFVGDITTLEIDAIVNAANNTLRGGGGVDGAIHRAAGLMLLNECKTLQGCETGGAKITGGYKLPAKYVIHTVGPIGENTELLTNCYVRCLTLAKENNVRTVAFPCISTGVFDYPNEKAAHVALKTARKFLEENESSFDRIIFCLFLPVDVSIYEKLMQDYFPV